MSIRCEHVEIVKTSPEKAFAAIDDLPLTAQWLPPCVSLNKVGDGPNAPGDTLEYVYKQGGQTGRMAGRIVDRLPGERLHCIYEDGMFAVSVDLRVAPDSAGAKMTHIIEMTPKKFIAKLFTPLIKIGIRKQTTDAAVNLKKLLEEGPSKA